MNKKTLTKLEYHKIIDILIEQATSFGGKERCKRLKPMTSITDIEAAQEQTAAAFTRIIKKGRPSFGSCNPVGESLKRLEVGAALGSGELLRICKLLENAGQIKAYGRHETVDDAEDCLDAFFQQIEPLTLVSTEIRRCIIDEDEISDDASSTLKQIRRSMNQINDKVHSTLSSLVKFKLYKGTITKAGTTSPYSLYSESLASFTTGDLYDHHDASGFINLFGLPLKVRAMKLQNVNKNQK